MTRSTGSAIGEINVLRARIKRARHIVGVLETLPPEPAWVYLYWLQSLKETLKGKRDGEPL